MSDNDKDDEQPKIKIVFMDGCFDDFDGTQEELDEMIAHIMEMAESGELLENSMPLGNIEDLEELAVNVDELAEDLVNKSIEIDEKYGFDEDGYVKFPFNNTRH